MKTKINLFSLGSLFLLIIFSIGFLYAQNNEKEVTITGTVIASDWDDEDNVVEVSISVAVEPENDEDDWYTEEYIVGKNKKGNELLNHVGKTVTVTGTIVTDGETDTMTIYVSKYEIIEEEPED